MKTFVIIIYLFSGTTAISQTDTLLDVRDGKVYKTVKIGNQVWMAENLRFMPVQFKTTKNDSLNRARLNIQFATIAEFRAERDRIKKDVVICYNDSVSNCNKYGALYSWEAANAACPSGWHLPSEVEFEELLNALPGNSRQKYDALVSGGTSGFNLLFAGDISTFMNLE